MVLVRGSCGLETLWMWRGTVLASASLRSAEESVTLYENSSPTMRLCNAFSWAQLMWGIPEARISRHVFLLSQQIRIISYLREINGSN